MPIIVVRNWPSSVVDITARNRTKNLNLSTIADNQNKHNFATVLREAVLKAEVPRITSVNMVTVSFDQGRPLAEDTLIVIEVVGLFSAPDRTKDIRDRLAVELANCTSGFWGEQVEVLVHRFNPEVDSYVRSNM